MPSLNLYKLEIFATVVRAGSFSAAANRLYMTQPAVSQHISDLETGLGTILFLRGRRGVTLTEKGETLYDYALGILRLVAEAENAVTDVENLVSGQITIGATPGVSTYLLPTWVHQFRQQYPNLNVVLQTGVTSDVVTGVLEHQMDLGFVEGELDTFQSKHLGRLVLRPVSMLVVVGQNHPWKDETVIEIDRLHGQPFITRQPNSRTRVWIDGTLATYGVRPRIVGEFDNQEAIKQAVMSNMGVSILPDYAVAHERQSGLLHALPLDSVALQRQIKLVWNDDGQMPLSPITQALLKFLSETFPAVRNMMAVPVSPSSD